MRLKASVWRVFGILLFEGVAAAGPPQPDVFLTVMATKRNANITIRTTSNRETQRWAEVLASATGCPVEQYRDGYEEDSAASFCASIPRTDLGRALRINLAPVKDEIERQGLHTVSLLVSAPVGTIDLHGVPLRHSSRRSMHFGTFSVSDLPASIDIRMERPAWQMPAFLASLAGLFALALAVSGVTTMRARSGTGPVADRWFSLHMCISLRGTGTWLGLWIVCSVFSGVEMMADSSGLPERYARLVVISGLVLAAAVVNVVCAAMEAPRYRDVRGLPVDASEIMRTEVLKDFCIACILIALSMPDVFTSLGFAGGMLPFIVALILVPLAARSVQRTIGIRPFAVSHGELRDAVFALAKRGNIALKNLYVLPATKWRLVNAFASRGNNVMLSEALVQALSKREVDALAAHELTHIHETHLQKIGLSIGFLIAPLVVAGAIVVVFAAAERTFDFLPFIGVLYILVAPSIRRRYEWRADAGAASLTGDPEATITGLVKITKLNCWPLRFDRRWSWLVTHPSTIRRVQAIARAWNIPQDRLAVLLNDESAVSGPSYTITPVETSNGRIFNTERKSRAGLTMTAALLVLMAGGPLLASVAASHASGWTSRLAVYAAATLLIAALDFVLANWISGSQNSSVGDRIWRKLEGSGRMPRNADAMLVGIAPSSTLRLYEGRYEWDIGFLWIQSGRLKFEGELSRFDVAPRDVVGINMADGSGRLPAAQKLYLTLHSGEEQGERTVGIRALGHVTVRAGRARTRRLSEQIVRWHQDRNNAAADATLSTVEIPAEGDVTAQSPRAVAVTGFRALIVLAGLAMGLAAMAGRYSPATLLMIPLIALLNACTRIWPLWRHKDTSRGSFETQRPLSAATP